jgi:hypothetical protein
MPRKAGLKTRRSSKSKRGTRVTRKPEGFPVLKKIDESGKRYKYKLNKTARARRMALNEGVHDEMKKTGKGTRRAAIAKKGRLNVLRIYRRYRNVGDCKKITRDMRYMDDKYKLGKTDEICGKTPPEDVEQSN